MNLPELGAFLQSRRARITPSEVGLPTGPRRRVPGLRRDEVAQLAGASVDYYIELERGRGAQPSTQTLAALARALRLDSDERARRRFVSTVEAVAPAPECRNLPVHPGTTRPLG